MKRIENPSLEWLNENQPFSKAFGDIYYSTDNGLGETHTVFIAGNHLPRRWQNQTNFTIAETGFGTGLNFLATWKYFEETTNADQRLDFISIEKYPLSIDDLKKSLRCWKSIIGNTYHDRLLECYPPRIPGFHRRWITPRVTLTLIFDDALRALSQLNCSIDAWYLDGFSPRKNPDLWHENLFREIARLSTNNTTLASFTAAGYVRRGLESAGFHIERQAGFGDKTHRITGHYTKILPHTILTPPKKIQIIGAGLAGTAVALCLNRRGIETVLIDQYTDAAMGASSNQLGLINPKIEAQDNPRTDLGQSAFSFAGHILQNHADDYRCAGALHLAHTPEKLHRLEKIYRESGWLEPHLEWIEPSYTKQICGVDIHHPALYYRDSSTVNTQAFVKKLASLSHFVPQTSWNIDHQQPTILCNGWGMKQIAELQSITFEAVRGQVIYGDTDIQLQCPIMFGSYCAPVTSTHWSLGATFDRHQTDIAPNDNDQIRILKSVRDVIPLNDFRITSQWAQLRTTTRDRYPVVGKIPKYDSLYALGALGSHGLQFSFILAEILACQITNSPLPVGRDAASICDINRFWKNS